MNVYLRRYFMKPTTTPADRARARMLATRSNELALLSRAQHAWLRMLAERIVHREVSATCKNLEERVSALESETRDARAVTAECRDRLNRIDRVAVRAGIRGDGWWKADPRIETFLRKAVADLHGQGFSDVQILTKVFIGMSPADLKQLRAAA